MKYIGCGILLFLFCLGNSNGPGTVQRRDRTGSPIAINSTCSNCHFGGNFDADLSISIWKDSTVVDQFEANEEYLIKVLFDHNGEGRQYGFQLVALTEESLVNAGTFTEVPEYIRKLNLYNDQYTYVEHTRPLDDSVWYIGWQAPEDVSEKIAFYAAGIVTNDNANTSGDEVVWLRTPHLLSPSSLVSSLKPGIKENGVFRIVNNPAIDFLKVELNSFLTNQKFDYAIYDLSGKELAKGHLTSSEIALYKLIKGSYVLTIYNNSFVSSQLFLVE